MSNKNKAACEPLASPICEMTSSTGYDFLHKAATISREPSTLLMNSGFMKFSGLNVKVSSGNRVFVIFSTMMSCNIPLSARFIMIASNDTFLGVGERGKSASRSNAEMVPSFNKSNMSEAISLALAPFTSKTSEKKSTEGLARKKSRNGEKMLRNAFLLIART